MYVCHFFFGGKVGKITGLPRLPQSLSDTFNYNICSDSLGITQYRAIYTIIALFFETEWGPE